jgi:hypothetical protein
VAGSNALVAVVDGGGANGTVTTSNIARTFAADPAVERDSGIYRIVDDDSPRTSTAMGRGAISRAASASSSA